ncbi:MAG: hypothetical protein HEQ13_22535 [Dolichospermum sp. DEX189]|nr:hypothetical protein [Dolichospermum sp. DEX189]
MSLWQGKRQEAKGKSEEGLGDFTFLYTVWFYCVHLLICVYMRFITLDILLLQQFLKTRFFSTLAFFRWR